MKYEQIASECRKMARICFELAREGAPDSVPEDEGGGHWTATRDELAAFLGRGLNETEVTALSLGRYFGPTPSFDESGRINMFLILFPQGNDEGAWYAWERLGKRLDTIAQMGEANFLREVTRIQASRDA